MALLAKVDSNRNPNVLYVKRNGDVVWLNWNYGNPDNEWNPENQFLFGAPRNYFHFSPLQICQEW